MERIPLFLAIGLLALVGALLAPLTGELRLVLGLVALGDCAALIFLLLRGTANKELSLPKDGDEVSKQEADRLADFQTLAFLGALQEKGRLVDFLMDDIGGHDDAAVGAAARVVYHGCRDALLKMVSIEPVASESEGSAVELERGRLDEYQLIGSAAEGQTGTGTLAHKGWRGREFKFPKVDATRTTPPVIAPAKVDV